MGRSDIMKIVHVKCFVRVNFLELAFIIIFSTFSLKENEIFPYTPNMLKVEHFLG